MSRIQKISLTQFRNYSLQGFVFSENITCITGANGSGKTSLLDAVYYLCYTKSYFSAQQSHSVKTGTDGFRLEGIFKNEEKEEQIVCTWRDGKKEVSAAGVAYEKVANHIGRFAAVMIAPDDMAIINEGSEGRRRWLDSILGQTDRQYLENLLRYQKVLLQRNAWLKLQATKPASNRDELEFYNAQLAETGQYIFQQRQHFLHSFLKGLNDFYHQLSGGNEAISIEYESDLLKNVLLKSLQQSFEQDMRLQRTTKGIHKDDLVLSIQGMPLKQYGSQGQKKSFLFALKLAQYQFLRAQLKQLPILLLDDVFEKLDQQRMEALLQIIQAKDFGQVLLTDTHYERVRAAFGKDVALGEIEL